MANSKVTLQDPSFKGYYSSDNNSDRILSALVPIYQFNQCYQYGKNIRLLYARRSTKEIGQNQGRYSQSKIPVPPGRKVRGIIK